MASYGLRLLTGEEGGRMSFPLFYEIALPKELEGAGRTKPDVFWEASSISANATGAALLAESLSLNHLRQRHR
jgi:hypothetical protein